MMQLYPLLCVVVGLEVVAFVMFCAPEIFGDGVKEYPSEQWCNLIIQSTDAAHSMQHFPGDDHNFCEFKYTDDQWHINRTAHHEWQFREKFGVDP